MATYAAKDVSTSLYYAGKGKVRWGTKEQAIWGTKDRIKAIIGGLRNSRPPGVVICVRKLEENDHERISDTGNV